MSNDKINTKSRLDDLKAMLESDPVKLNAEDITPDLTDFPMQSQIKYVDYDEEKQNHKEFAGQVITNIIETYVKSDKLLNSPRLKDLKQNDIKKYAYLLLMTSIAETNLIRVQESIDGGDMSKDMFMTVKQASMELRDCVNGTEKHLEKCEKYWSNYASIYGMENTEEQIVAETEVKDDTNKTTIINMADLTNNIHDIVASQKQKEKEDKAKED